MEEVKASMQSKIGCIDCTNLLNTQSILLLLLLAFMLVLLVLVLVWPLCEVDEVKASMPKYTRTSNLNNTTTNDKSSKQ